LSISTRRAEIVQTQIASKASICAYPMAEFRILRRGSAGSRSDDKTYSDRRVRRLRRKSAQAGSPST